MVTSKKLKIGVPSHFNHAGILRCNPIFVVHSETAPMGQRIPHQLRPVKMTEMKTKGNQIPHNKNCANKVKLLNRVACSAGCGRNSGITMSAKNNKNNVV